MQLNNKQMEFITLRADGLSFDKIAKQLKISKATLIQWSKLFEDNIKENDENIFENRYINTHLDLVKLFVEKNRGLFWIKNSKYNTSYYIKLKSENI